MLSDRWREYFGSLSIAVSKASKDASTKVGCVIYRPDKTVCSTGFNGFPRGIEDTLEMLGDRKLKYPRIIHAECNAIYHSRECMYGYGIFVSTPPCDKCALAIAGVGITSVYAFLPTTDYLNRWEQQYILALEIMQDANISYQEIKKGAD